MSVSTLLLISLISVNRCQTEIQRSVGTPAQTSHLEETQRIITALEQKIDNLGNRIDVIQMVSAPF